MPKQITVAILLAASLSACLDDPEGVSRVRQPAEGLIPSSGGVTDPSAPPPSPRSTPATRDEDTGFDLCAVLPTDDDDPCSHLCDADSVTPYIPAGTCVTFVCQLTDGTTIRAGGCRPAP